MTRLTPEEIRALPDDVYMTITRHAIRHGLAVVTKHDVERVNKAIAKRERKALRNKGHAA